MEKQGYIAGSRARDAAGRHPCYRSTCTGAIGASS